MIFRTWTCPHLLLITMVQPAGAKIVTCATTPFLGIPNLERNINFSSPIPIANDPSSGSGGERDQEVQNFYFANFSRSHVFFFFVCFFFCKIWQNCRLNPAFRRKTETLKI